MVLTIEEMTRMSYVMLGLSGLFAVMSIVTFWTFDIKRSWVILCGRKNRKFIEHNARQIQELEIKKIEKPEAEKIETHNNSTVLLENNKTVKLSNGLECEETVLLENKGFVIFQNITYYHDINM